MPLQNYELKERATKKTTLVFTWNNIKKSIYSTSSNGFDYSSHPGFDFESKDGLFTGKLLREGNKYSWEVYYKGKRLGKPSCFNEASTAKNYIEKWILRKGFIPRFSGLDLKKF